MDYEEREKQDRANVVKLVGRIGGGLFVALFALLFVTGGFYSIGQRERGIQTRFGEIVAITGPGLHFKMPFIEGVRHIEVSTQTINWQHVGQDNTLLEAYSRDQQPADIAMTLTWHVKPDAASVRSVATQWGDIDGVHTAVIVPSATEAFKNVFGTYDAVSAIQRRAELNAQVLEAVRAQVANRPVVIDSVQLQDIAFSQAYEQAVEARMTAQVEVQRAEQQKQTQQIQSDMLVIRARADADATRLAGEAQAAAIRARAEALRTSPELVQLTLAEKWNGVLPTTMVPGAGVPLLNVH